MSHPALTQLRAVPMVNRGLPVVPSFLCQR